MAIIFFIGFIVCAIGWAVTKISVLAIGYWIKEKGLSPTDDEIRKCASLALKKMLHIK